MKTNTPFQSDSTERYLNYAINNSLNRSQSIESQQETDIKQIF